jgi:amidase
MSIVALADGPRQVTADELHEIAAKNNITISNKDDEEGYLLLLESLDAVVKQVEALPDYVDPSLEPVAVVGGARKWWKEERNSRNAWSHRTNLRAEKPTSYLLSGRTVAIKDNASVAGVPFTAGTFPVLLSKDGKYPIPEIDAPVVSRVLNAGGMIMGTATCENYSLTPMSYTSANGPMHNPWLYGYNAGGSSSGNAFLLALQAAREAGVPGLEGAGPHVDMAVGGDQAGSIRLPAAYSGVYGLKPSYGLVPYTGMASHHALYDHAGPMARNLKDIATLLEVLAGYDGLDPRMTPETPLRQNVPKYSQLLSDFTSTPNPQLGKKMKIGLITESFNLPGSSTEVSNLVSTAARTHFESAGATVSEVSIPLHTLGPHIWTAATRPHLAPLAVGGRAPDTLSFPMPHFTPRWPPDQEMYSLLTSANPAIINVLFSTSFIESKYPHADTTAKAQRHVHQLRAAYDAALSEYDVLITPTTGTVAPRMPFDRDAASVLEKVMSAVGATNNTCPFNVTGHPGLSVPCGWARGDGVVGERNDGKGGWLPVGMQIIGRRWGDLEVLKAAAVFERGRGGLGMWPGRV